MRFRGGGIGHKVTRDWDEFLQRDFGKCVEVDENNDETDSEEGLMDPELQVEGDKVEEWKGVMEEDVGICNHARSHVAIGPTKSPTRTCCASVTFLAYILHCTSTLPAPRISFLFLSCVQITSKILLTPLA